MHKFTLNNFIRPVNSAYNFLLIHLPQSCMNPSVCSLYHKYLRTYIPTDFHRYLLTYPYTRNKHQLAFIPKTIKIQETIQIKINTIWYLKHVPTHLLCGRINPVTCLTYKYVAVSERQVNYLPLKLKLAQTAKSQPPRVLLHKVSLFLQLLLFWYELQ
jgi:hypothetical protein